MLVEKPSISDWIGRPGVWLSGLAAFLFGVATVAVPLRLVGSFLGLSHDPSPVIFLVLLGALIIVMIFPFGADLPERGWMRFFPHWSVGVGIAIALLVAALVAPKFVPPAQPTALEWELLGAGAAFAASFIAKSPEAAPVSLVSVLGFLFGVGGTAALVWTLHGAQFLASSGEQAVLGLGGAAAMTLLALVGLAIVGVALWFIDKLIARSERIDIERRHGR